MRGPGSPKGWVSVTITMSLILSMAIAAKSGGRAVNERTALMERGV
jgi:hypothetical protein